MNFQNVHIHNAMSFMHLKNDDKATAACREPNYTAEEKVRHRIISKTSKEQGILVLIFSIYILKGLNII